MTIQTFLRKLNWRLIMVHFVAGWFLMHSFQQLAFLSNINLYKALMSFSYDPKTLNETLFKTGYDIADVLVYAFYERITWTLGLLTAFILSIIISIRKGWFWVNSLIVFLLLFFLQRQDLLGWNYLKNIFLKPGELFHTTTLYLLINGLVLLGLGLFFFFFKPSNRFISKGQIASTHQINSNEIS